MDDFISRKDVMALWDEYHPYIATKAIEFDNKLRQLPSAEPKKGQWIDMGDFEQCSACTATQLKTIQTVYGEVTWIKTDYCPNCGARMEE